MYFRDKVSTSQGRFDTRLDMISPETDIHQFLPAMKREVSDENTFGHFKNISHFTRNAKAVFFVASLGYLRHYNTQRVFNRNIYFACFDL